MRLVTPLLKKVVYPALSMAGVFRRTSATGLAVVTYHGVMPPGYEPVDPAFDGNLISAEMLRRQLRLLKAHYNLVSPEDVLAWRQDGRELPKRAVLVTCDDGLLNCMTDMLPVLQEERVRCLFFVTGASAGQLRTMLWFEELYLLLLRASTGPFAYLAEGIGIEGDLGARAQRRTMWWDAVKRLSQVDAASRESFLDGLRTKVGFNVMRDIADNESASSRRYRLLTAAELRQLAASGMSIGAHSLSHPMLSQMHPELAYAEICESRERLESALQQQVWAFAYPFGDPQSVTRQVLAMTHQSGYEVAFMNFGGGLGTSLPVYSLPRIHVTSGMNLAEFEAHVCSFYSRLQRRAGRSQEYDAFVPTPVSQRPAPIQTQVYRPSERAVGQLVAR